ncbi:hypothetical protein EDB81DRAFT_159646 [Dactylonectria macrodidyma]|uniref:Uncharacterized protein n=1 Tax=Dactylonectria macrodidyma TaxID=307937 RepID=A0A9P9JH34_9HYPO|nr:hypothetical protein EDB81DRAFT_159646 [Dactylonectria macrodidyma]
MTVRAGPYLGSLSSHGRYGHGNQARGGLEGSQGLWGGSNAFHQALFFCAVFGGVYLRREEERGPFDSGRWGCATMGYWPADPQSIIRTIEVPQKRRRRDLRDSRTGVWLGSGGVERGGRGCVSRSLGWDSDCWKWPKWRVAMGCPMWLSDGLPRLADEGPRSHRPLLVDKAASNLGDAHGHCTEVLLEVPVLVSPALVSRFPLPSTTVGTPCRMHWPGPSHSMQLLLLPLMLHPVRVGW